MGPSARSAEGFVDTAKLDIDCAIDEIDEFLKVTAQVSPNNTGRVMFNGAAVTTTTRSCAQRLG